MECQKEEYVETWRRVAKLTSLATFACSNLDHVKVLATGFPTRA
jgi:hypothetical protein